MISIVLIAPIIFCLILLFAKNNKLNNFFMVLYSIIHFILGLFYFIKPDLIGNNQYFSLNNANIIFYIVLSIVYLAVSIYNLGYSKNLESAFKPKKIMHYSTMILIFVLSMTGGIWANNLGLAWIFIEGTTLASAYLIYFNKTKLNK